LLWLYLQKALLGVPSQLGIYQTPAVISKSLFEPAALLATFAWLALAVASIIWRRRYPLLALGVLWYLTGHIIESSVLPLELYFEHRNYLPVVGPVYALSAALISGRARVRRAALVAVPLYVLVSAYFLYIFASLSGEPSPASRYWAIKYPDSVRAVSTMATYQLAEEGPISALSTIDQFAIERPQFGYLRIQELNLRCMYFPDQNHEPVLEELRRELPNVEFTYTAGTMLSQLFSTVGATDCAGVGFDTVVELAEKLLHNPRYALDPEYNQFHHKLMAGIARQQGNYDATIDHLKKAISHRGSAELNMMVVTALGGAGDFDGANRFIDDTLDRLPASPFQAAAWRRDLEELRNYIRELERYSRSAE
jgi:tetratricopeptide (TPR) repeat protein